MTRRLQLTFAMQPPALAEALFATSAQRLAAIGDVEHEVVAEIDSGAARRLLPETDVLIAGWGAPFLEAATLDSMPNLQAVLYAGGTASAVLDLEEASRREIRWADAGDANAKGVAEYTFATIVMANKRASYAERLYRTQRKQIDREATLSDSGSFDSVIGLVGASRIGRRVAELLKQTDMRVLIYDPYASRDEIGTLGAEKAGLDELLAASDVVSIHAPELPETRRMIGGRELALMRDGATLINTARGSLVDHDALLDHLRAGRLHAILDVTDPEPLPHDAELWELPNVTLTPHIAGATGNELHRMGDALVTALERLVADGAVKPSRTTMRHRVGA